MTTHLPEERPRRWRPLDGVPVNGLILGFHRLDEELHEVLIPEDAVTGYLASCRADPATLDVERGDVTLPSGRAAYSGYLDDDGVHHRNHYLARTDRWLKVGCGSRTPPSDRWLSILETFERL